LNASQVTKNAGEMQRQHTFRAVAHDQQKRKEWYRYYKKEYDFARN